MGGIRESLGDSKNAVAEVLRNRNLRRLNLAFAGSVIGDWAYAMAASVYAYNNGGATAVGLLGVARFVSMAVTAPFASMMADKFERRRVMVAADAIRVVLVLIAALVIGIDGPPMAVYGLTVVIAVVGTAFRPAQGALMPSLANHPGELTAANAVSSTIESVGFFVGPAIGALLLAVTGIAQVYVFDAITFAWSALFVMGLLPAPNREVSIETEASNADIDGVVDHTTDEQADRRFLSDVTAGYREIFANRHIRLLVGLYCAQTVVAGASVVFIVAVALDLLKLNESGVGVLNAAMGVGGIAGGIIALLLAQRGKLARDFGLGVILWAAPVLLIAAWPTLASGLIALALIGVGNTVVDVNAFTILQRLVPDEVMGRVLGAMESAIIAGMALGALLMPILIHSIGLRNGLTVIGVSVSALVVIAIGGLRRIDKVALAPDGLELLKAEPILGLLPESVIELLARHSKLVTVRAGQQVFKAGDHGDLFYVIESGTAEVIKGGEIVASLVAGDSFGEIALLRDIPRTATVTTTSELTARTIDRDVFLAAVTGHGDSANQAELMIANLLGSR